MQVPEAKHPRASVVCRRSSRLVEIVADADRHVLLRFSDGDELRLALTMDMTAALQELQAVGVATKPSKSLWRLGSSATPAGTFPLTPLQFTNDCCANMSLSLPQNLNPGVCVGHTFKVDTI